MTNKDTGMDIRLFQSRPSPDQLNRSLADHFSRVVGQFVSAGQPYALLDFPDYSNIGDSAIYAGEMAFFDRHVGREPDYVCSLSIYRQDIEVFCPEGPLFLNGGGNFGTIWRKHQAFRHDVIERYKNRRIVQLAQSIHFDSSDRQILEDSKRVIGNHPDFTLLVRDLPSRDFAQAEFNCPVIMCPDASHCLLHLPPVRTPQHKVLSLMRDDKEASYQEDVATKLYQQGPVTDWGRQPLARTLGDWLVEGLLRPVRPNSTALMRRRERMYRRQANYRVTCGVRLLSDAQIIVSDRLHGHLISGLMGKPHLCLDNSYGKVSRYLAAWGWDSATVHISGMANFDATLEQLKQGLMQQ